MILVKNKAAAVPSEPESPFHALLMELVDGKSRDRSNREWAEAFLNAEVWTYSLAQTAAPGGSIDGTELNFQLCDGSASIINPGGDTDPYFVLFTSAPRARASIPTCLTNPPPNLQLSKGPARYILQSIGDAQVNVVINPFSSHIGILTPSDRARLLKAYPIASSQPLGTRPQLSSDKKPINGAKPSIESDDTPKVTKSLPSLELHISENEVVGLHRAGKYKFYWTPGKKPRIENLISSRLILSPSGKLDFSAALESTPFVDAIALDEKQIMGLFAKDASAYLGVGEVGNEGSFSLSARLSIENVTPHRVKWPAGLVWSSPEGRYDENGKKFIATGARFSLSSNRWGIAAASNNNGVVTVVNRPGAAQRLFAVQVPTQPEVELYAEATATGVLVSLTVEGRESALLSLSEDGTIRAQRESSGTPCIKNIGQFFLVADRGSENLLVLDEHLKVVSCKRTPFDVDSLAVASDQKSFALANRSHVCAGAVDQDGNISLSEDVSFQSAELQQRRANEINEIESRYEPAILTGEPLVGFGTERSNPRWSGIKGNEFLIQIPARSTGGAGQGVQLVLSGNALKAIKINEVSIGDHHAELHFAADGKSITAIIAGLSLPSGLVYPLDPQPKNEAQKQKAAELLNATQFTFQVRGEAHQESNEILTIAASACNSNGSAMKMAAPLTITSG